MVRTTTRRTRTDLRTFADAVTHTRVDRDAVDVDRLRRFESHGWATNDAKSTTGDGHRIAGVVETLRNPRADEVDDLDFVVDIMGMADFVEACVRAESPQDAVAYMRGLLVVSNTIDEARHEAGTQDVEFDHDGLFAPHLVDFDARRGTVEVRFKDKATASLYRRKWCPDRFDVERKHDERFKSNRNPRRLVVDVMGAGE